MVFTGKDYIWFYLTDYHFGWSLGGGSRPFRKKANGRDAMHMLRRARSP